MGRGIVDLDGIGLSQKRREITAAVSCVGETLQRRSPGSEAEAFVINEKKRLIFSVIQLGYKHRTTKSAAEIILCIDAPFLAFEIIYPAVCFQRVVAQVVIT